MQRDKPINYPAIVKVDWFDAHSVDEWDDIGDLADEEPNLCETVGWLLHESPSRVVVAGSLEPENKDACCTMVIPRGMIVNIAVLKPAHTDPAA